MEEKRLTGLQESTKDEMSRTLQKQIADLKQKAMKISRPTIGLIDSGATHALRPAWEEEDSRRPPEVGAKLASREKTRRTMSPHGSTPAGDKKRRTGIRPVKNYTAKSGEWMILTMRRRL